MHAPAVRRVTAAEVPIVDFGALYSPSVAERKTMARAIRAACAGPGFFYIVNHQFPQAVIARAQAAMQRFFALPVAQKMRNHYLDWPNHRGYVPSGGITADHSLEGSSDISEAIEMAHDLPADDPDHVRGIRFYGPQQLASRSPPTFAGRSAPISTASWSWAARSSAPSSTRSIWRRGTSPPSTPSRWPASASATTSRSRSPSTSPTSGSARIPTTSASPPSGRTGRGCRC